MMPGCETNFLFGLVEAKLPTQTKKLDFTKARP